MHDPQQELFSRLLVNLKTHFNAQGYEVFDGALPPADTPYPFVYLGDFRQTDTDTKTQTMGTVYPTIHVWHNNTKQRGTVSMMLLEIKQICRAIEHTDNFSWDYKRPSQRIYNDTTTKTALVHGVLELEFAFS